MFAEPIGRPVILPYFKRLEKEILRYLVCFIKPKFKILRSILAFSILYGTLFVPVIAEAGFFSIFEPGTQAYAATDANTVKPPQSGLNLQDPSLALQVNGSFQIKDDKNKASALSDITDNTDTALIPATGPLGVSDGKDVADPSSQDTSVYVVRAGDSITSIADIFGVSVNTILWANDMKKGEKLVEGNVLLILPISGLEHIVTKNETLQTIAKRYKADVSDIAFYNGIAQDAKLAVGDKLMIPGGDIYDEGGDKPSPNLKATEIKDKNYYATSLLKNIIGYFINPLPTGRKTQGLHGPGNRGIDMGAPTGTNIYASAPGTVLIVKTGCEKGRPRCGGGYGNMAIIQHDNGTKTLYGHMSKVITRTGAQVSRGEVIGFVGSTGRSTGPHLHFEVFNAKNPGADWSWAN